MVTPRCAAGEVESGGDDVYTVIVPRYVFTTLLGILRRHNFLKHAAVNGY